MRVSERLFAFAFTIVVVVACVVVMSSCEVVDREQSADVVVIELGARLPVVTAGDTTWVTFAGADSAAFVEETDRTRCPRVCAIAVDVWFGDHVQRDTILVELSRTNERPES